MVLFWYDVLDFEENNQLTYDRSSKSQHAWAIFNSYLSSSARFSVSLPSRLTDKIRSDLQYMQNSKNSSLTSSNQNLFQPVIEELVSYLENAWLSFLKDDIMKYTE